MISNIKLKGCSRIGIETTWRCNFSCNHCFYLRNPNFKSGKDISYGAIINRIQRELIERNCNHVVLIGYGEPALSNNFIPILNFCKSKNIAISVITNGTANLSIYKQANESGIDHFHLSMHDIRERADNITNFKNTFEKQKQLLNWIKENNTPWRCNTTIQNQNIDNLENIVDVAIDYGVYHFVFLNFLTHYEWKNHVKDCAVHPEIIGKKIEKAADKLIESNIFFTIRYFPFCYIDSKYWKYIVNSYYVAYDPWEWKYGNAGDSDKTIAEKLRSNVEIDSCKQCNAYLHCAGWDRNYNSSYGEIIKHIKSIPDEYKNVWNIEGSIFLMNPVNHFSGTIK